jgi:thioredoxin-like negative regulator of GroEL
MTTETEVNKTINKVVFVTAPWCQPCAAYKPNIDSASASIKSYGYAIEYINADEDRQFCKDYLIRGVPSTLIFHGDKVVEQFAGNKTKEELLEKIYKVSEI